LKRKGKEKTRQGKGAPQTKHPEEKSTAPNEANGLSPEKGVHCVAGERTWQKRGWWERELGDKVYRKQSCLINRFWGDPRGIHECGQ